ncbi:MAG: transporter suffix domain-containing protein [Desulfobacterales bacterium]
MTNDPVHPDWRFRIGVIVFVVSWCSPLLIPLVTASDLPTRWKTIVSGALAVGIPEIGTILAIAIMGKSGFDTMKKRIFGFLKKHGPPDRVGLARYRIGLVMFVMPLLFGWLSPYLQGLFTQIDAHRNLLAITGDLLLVGSLFVLGGDFWDKVRSLFVHDAIAVLPENSELEKV